MREHLNAAAERRKDDYDIKVKSTTFSVGDSVWYFYPRRYTQKSPKWSKNYTGPFKVIKVIAPCDYVIQRSRRAKPQVVHGDKLKRHYGEPLPDWSTEQPDDRQSAVSPGDTEVKAATPKSSPKKHVRFQLDNVECRIYDDLDEVPVRGSPRVRRAPAQLNDYYVY